VAILPEKAIFFIHFNFTINAAGITGAKVFAFLYKPPVRKIKMPHHYFAKIGKGRAAG
jgi:hypothetical protein